MENLEFPNAVVLSVVVRRRAQKSGKARAQNSAKGRKERKRALPRKSCKGLKQPGFRELKKIYHHPESKKRKSSEGNSGSTHPYGRYGNAGKTSKTISTIAIRWSVKAIFDKRAATVEVDTFISSGFGSSQEKGSVRTVHFREILECPQSLEKQKNKENPASFWLHFRELAHRLLMGLFRGAVLHRGGVPENSPFNSVNEAFPSLVGRFPTLMGRFLECLNGPFFPQENSLENSPLRKGASRGS